jgi:hypothetical protein
MEQLRRLLQQVNQRIAGSSKDNWNVTRRTGNGTAISLLASSSEDDYPSRETNVAGSSKTTVKAGSPTSDRETRVENRCQQSRDASTAEIPETLSL